jgi:hypothetical protein
LNCSFLSSPRNHAARNGDATANPSQTGKPVHPLTRPTVPIQLKTEYADTNIADADFRSHPKRALFKRMPYTVAAASPSTNTTSGLSVIGDLKNDVSGFCVYLEFHD